MFKSYEYRLIVRREIESLAHSKAKNDGASLDRGNRSIYISRAVTSLGRSGWELIQMRLHEDKREDEFWFRREVPAIVKEEEQQNQKDN